jgi:cytochrome c553
MAVGLPAADANAGREFFEMKVRPLLASRCGGCHIAGAMAGLKLDTREHAVKGGKSGAAIVPGRAADSLLIQAVAQTHPSLKMPPGGKLTDEEVGALRQWVDAGAIWPDASPVVNKAAPYTITKEQRTFWSFQPVRLPAVPKNDGRTAIDRFTVAALSAKGLKQAGPADRRTLLRRASLDLTGLPPTPEEVDAFIADRSPDAFAKVVDRLLASPQYGARWARYWLDIARYSDDKLNPTQDEPIPNAFRYRDWVIGAMNRDLPYDQFLKAQIAGDLLPDPEPAALGFYALSPEFQDDRVDATSRGFLGLTVACAQCHDHKFDPIPQRDYYSLLAVFNNTQAKEYPLAPEAEVKAWRAQKARVDKVEKELNEFIARQARELADILATKTARFLLAARKLGPADGLDAETLKRWQKYLDRKDREHPFLKKWDASPSTAEAEAFQKLLIEVSAEEKTVEEKNKIKLGLDPSRRELSQASLDSLPRDKYVLWREVFDGVLKYRDKDIERYLSGEWKEHLTAVRARLQKEKDALPKQYAFLLGVEDLKKLKTQRIYLRGMRDNPGDEVAPHFLQILSPGEPKSFTKGAGRLELAEAIASPSNPLTARVMANRIWAGHFGEGLVRTPSNFGQLGDRPSHPELLDYLASRFVENGWSMKKLHREIMLSSTYQLSTEYLEKNVTADPENRLLWRANRRRLDAESLRDSTLFAVGALDLELGGPPEKLAEEKNVRRTVYGFVSRRNLDPMLQLFDFPNPNSTSEQRLSTNVPLQRLYFMNSPAEARAAKALAGRVTGATDRDKIRAAYRRLFGRLPSEAETRLGLEFLHEGSWPQYAQVLLGSNEFTFIP